MKNQKTMGNKGFSLVELIVVIAIMAVLVGVLAPQFIKYVEKARIATDIQNLDQIKTAVETYIVENPVTDEVKLFADDFSTSSSNTEATVSNSLKAALTDAGLGETVKFKSSKWTGVNITVSDSGQVTVSGTATYNGTTYSAAGTSDTTDTTVSDDKDNGQNDDLNE
jgi:type IV pilus assembly protein PilA